MQYFLTQEPDIHRCQCNRGWIGLLRFCLYNQFKIVSNEKGSKVEADVAMCPLLSLFRREENRDGDTYVPYALHNY